jgi:hypothetical protein
MDKDYPTPLESLLYDYENRLRSLGAPVDCWVEPGLEDAALEAALAPLSLRLPAEGRAWWTWHAGPTSEGRDKLFGPSGPAITLSQAVALYTELRTVAEKSASAWPQNDPDYLWNPAWFPIKGTQLPIVVDCSVPDDDPTPVRFIDWQAIDGFFVPKAAALSQVVEWWIEAIDVGAWEWDASRGCWLQHYDRLTHALRTNPLM